MGNPEHPSHVQAVVAWFGPTDFLKVVPVQMSINFAAKLEQVLGKDRVQLELLEGTEHGDPRFEAPDNVKKVLAFLDRHVK